MMPWHIGQSAECDGFAVIKDDDSSIAGCHETEEAAKAQMAALYASEGDVEESITTTNATNTAYVQVDSTVFPVTEVVSIPSAQELGSSTSTSVSSTEAYSTPMVMRNGIPVPLYSIQEMKTQIAINEARNLMDQALSILESLDQDDEPMTEAALTEAALTEASTGHVIAIEEAQVDNGKVVPLTLDIAVIEPGPGNPADNHYYPAEMLRRDAGVFKEAKMFTSDHQDDKNVRQWVSTVKNCPVGFTESGAPIARVVVHDEPFAKTLLALNESQLLHKMECSILGSGKATKQEIDEHEYNVVEAITAAESVDWVTRAGAGGRALAIAESDAPTPETGETDMDENETEVQESETVILKEDETETGEQPLETEPETKSTEDDEATEDEVAALSADDVTEIFKESGLGEDAIDLLSAREYADEQSVKEAVDQLKQLIKKASGSGQPFAQGETRPVKESTEEREKRGVSDYRAIKEKWGSSYDYRLED